VGFFISVQAPDEGELKVVQKFQGNHHCGSFAF
jgi:hypothetical protein